MKSGNIKITKFFSFFILLLFLSGLFIGLNFISNEAKAQLPNGILIGTITFYNNQSSSIPAYTPIYFYYNISILQKLPFNGIFDANGNVYYAYAMIEDYNNNYIIWVNLTNGMNANSQLTLYLMYNSSWSGYVFNEAYAVINSNWTGDNGNLVFPYYVNFFELTSAPSNWNGYGYTITSNYGANVSGTGSANSFNLLQFTKPINYWNNYLYSNWCVDIYAKGLSSWGTPSGGSYGIYEEFGLFNTYATSQTSGVSVNPAIYVLNNYGKSGTTLNIANSTGSTYSIVYKSVPNNGGYSWFDFGMLNNQAFVLINAYNDFAFNLSYMMGYNNASLFIGFPNQTYAVNQNYYFGIYLFDTNTSFNDLGFVFYRNLPPNGVYPAYSITPYTPYNISFNFQIYDSSVSSSPAPCEFQGNIYTNVSPYASISFPYENTLNSNYLNFSVSSPNINTFYFNFNITNSGNNLNMFAIDSKANYTAQVMQVIVNANASVSYSLTYYQNSWALLPEFNASITFTGYNVSITFVLYNVNPFNFFDLPFNYSYKISIQSVLLEANNTNIYNIINYNTPQYTMNSNITIWTYSDVQTYPYINFTIYKSGFFGLGSSYTSINVQGNNSIAVSDNYPYKYNYAFFDPYTLSISYSGISYNPYFYISSPNFISSNTYYIPITITNNQNISTPNPYQQMIQINISQYSNYIIYNYSYANFYFIYTNGVVIPAWIESYNTSTGIITIWLNLNSINVNSSITIYMLINNNNNLDVNIGEAPQLSPTYGEYDNGASIFSFYDNFVGTSLNTSKWTTVSTPPSGRITVDNGVSFINTGNNVYYVSSTSFTAPYVIDMGGILGTEADDGPWFDLESTTSIANTGYLWATRGNSNVAGDDQLYTDSNGNYSAFVTASGMSGTSNFAVYTLEDVGGSSGTIDTFVNYNSWLSGSSTSFTHSGYFSPFRHGNNITPASILYWARTRAYPPNGVMPTVELM